MSATLTSAYVQNASSWTRAPGALEQLSSVATNAATTTAAAAELPFDGTAIAVAIVSGACALAGSALNLLLGAAVLLTARRRRRGSHRRCRCCCWNGCGGLGPADIYVASIAGADLLQSCVYLPCVAVGNAYRADVFGHGGCVLLTWLQATCIGVIWANHCAMALYWAALTFAADARLLDWRGRVASAVAVAATWAAMGALSAASSSRDVQFVGVPNYHCSAEYRTPYHLALMAARLAPSVALAPVAYVVAFVRIVRFKAIVRGQFRSTLDGHCDDLKDGCGGRAEIGRGDGGRATPRRRDGGALGVVALDCSSDSNGSGGPVGSSADSSGVSEESRDHHRLPSAAKELRMLRSTIVMFVVFSALYVLSAIARLATSSVGTVTAGHCALYVTSVVNAPLLLSINRDYGRALGHMFDGKGAGFR